MYQPVNRCIYCLRADVSLSREHIIPLALGGTYVLPRASCSEHAAVTSRFEGEVARVGYGIQRALERAPTRRPKQQQLLLERPIMLSGEDYDGNAVHCSVAAKEVPPLPVILRMDAPGLLRGEAEDAQGGYRVDWSPATPHLRALRERLGWKSITGPVSTLPMTAFSRTLAKIGHAFAVAEIGLDYFEPVLLPLILDVPPWSAWHYVGEHAPAAQQSKVPLRTRELSIGGRNWYAVDISIRQFPAWPMYQVIVGRPRLANSCRA